MYKKGGYTPYQACIFKTLNGIGADLDLGVARGKLS